MLIFGIVIDKELQKHESEYSTFRPLRVLICTWNADSVRPDALTSTYSSSDETSLNSAANLSFLHDVLNSVDAPDIIVFGLQEVINLESRKMTAKNVFMNSSAITSSKSKKNKQKAHHEDTYDADEAESSLSGLRGLSDKVTGAYMRWYTALLVAVRLSMPADNPYTVVYTESLIGLFTCVFVRNAERGNVKEGRIATLKRGMGGRYGNKVCFFPGFFPVQWEAHWGMCSGGYHNKIGDR